MFFPVKISIFHETGLRKRFQTSKVLAIDFSHQISPKESFWRKKFRQKIAQMTVFLEHPYIFRYEVVMTHQFKSHAANSIQTV
jgi:hypothetical protein